MKVVILEPLGIPKENILRLMKRAALDADIIYFDTRELNSQMLVQRIANAEIVVLSNLPLKKEVLENCPNLKMISQLRLQMLISLM